MGRFIKIKMLILPKLMRRFNTIPILITGRTWPSVILGTEINKLMKQYRESPSKSPNEYGYILYIIMVALQLRWARMGYLTSGTDPSGYRAERK